MKHPDAARTHSVAVSGYVFHGDRTLLLKRNNPPLIWAPPGGRLLVDEDPKAGIMREVREESGLTVDIVGLVNYWFGTLPKRGLLLSLDFVLHTNNTNVVLSPEHSAYEWVLLSELSDQHLNPEAISTAYRVEDFQRAFNLYKRYNLPLNA